MSQLFNDPPELHSPTPQFRRRWADPALSVDQWHRLAEWITDHADALRGLTANNIVLMARTFAPIPRRLITESTITEAAKLVGFTIKPTAASAGGLETKNP